MKHRGRGIGPVRMRHCGKCGKTARFVCSGKFRVNANGKRLDVWLIYRCDRCDTVWNMEIFSRVKPQTIPGALYQAFLDNDPDVALRYAQGARQGNDETGERDR